MLKPCIIAPSRLESFVSNSTLFYKGGKIEYISYFSIEKIKALLEEGNIHEYREEFVMLFALKLACSVAQCVWSDNEFTNAMEGSFQKNKQEIFMIMQSRGFIQNSGRI